MPGRHLADMLSEATAKASLAASPDEFVLPMEYRVIIPCAVPVRPSVHMCVHVVCFRSSYALSVLSGGTL